MICTCLQGWTRIAKAVNADTKVSNRIVYDVLNEPDVFGLKFEPANGKPGMRNLYFQSFDAIYAVNPGVLRCCIIMPICAMHCAAYNTILLLGSPLNTAVCLQHRSSSLRAWVSRTTAR